MNKNIRFLSSVLVLCVFGITEANAAPSVRMLGTNTARIGTNATAVRSNDNTNTSTQRLGSIRSKTVGAGTPVTVNKITTPSVASESGSDARLSLGKYIHTTGVANGSIKPAAASTTSVLQEDFNSLADRVIKLEHDKQDALSADSGVVIENNVIGLDESILGLSGRIDGLQEQVEAKISASDLDETISEALDEQIGEDINTVYDAATGERRYVAIVDEFTSKDFESIQNQGED